LTKVDEVKATCTTEGNTAYYKCDCGKYFSDEEGTTEIENNSWVTDATGHDLTGEYSYAIDGTKAYKVEACDHGDNVKTELTDYVIATTDNVSDVVAEVVEGQTIVLTSGDYNSIRISDNNITTAQNITIVGTDDVTINYIYINGMVNDEITIDNITFDGTVVNYLDENAGVIIGVDGVKDLTIRNCDFVNNSRVLGNGEGEDISVVNILIEDCSFDMTNMEDVSETLSAINIWGSNGVVIRNNTIKNAEYNAIQLAGEINGDVLIENNIIDGTGDRALRFNNVNKAVTIKNNTIKNVHEEKGEVLKATAVKTGGSLIFYNNSYDDNPWVPNNVTTEATNVIYTITKN
jgi:hypothetical protein